MITNDDEVSVFAYIYVLLTGRGSLDGSDAALDASGTNIDSVSSTFFPEDLVMKIFYGHSSSSAESRRAVIN